MKDKNIVYRRDYDEEGIWMHTYSKYVLNKDGSLTPFLNLALNSEGMSTKQLIENSINANKIILKEMIKMLGGKNGKQRNNK